MVIIIIILGCCHCCNLHNHTIDALHQAYWSESYVFGTTKCVGTTSEEFHYETSGNIIKCEDHGTCAILDFWIISGAHIPQQVHSFNAAVDMWLWHRNYKADTNDCNGTEGLYWTLITTMAMKEKWDVNLIDLAQDRTQLWPPVAIANKAQVP